MSQGIAPRRTGLWLGLGLCGVLVGGLVIWMLGNSDRHDPARADVSGPYYTPITEQQETEAKEMAVHSRAVQALGAGRQVKVESLEPWINSGGTQLLGAIVHIGLRPAVRLQRQRLPAYVTPGPSAPAGTPSMERYVVISGTGVSELNASVLLKKGRVVSVEPSGRHAAITGLHLVGPPPGPAYRRPEGE